MQLARRDEPAIIGIRSCQAATFSFNIGPILWTISAVHKSVRSSGRKGRADRAVLSRAFRGQKWRDGVWPGMFHTRLHGRDLYRRGRTLARRAAIIAAFAGVIQSPRARQSFERLLPSIWRGGRRWRRLSHKMLTQALRELLRKGVVL